ncbi:hypothetical protein LV779_26645 [Streptomyces thinghirensis]|nr:hypothetical protein [Streptomyces thinghirensis]
MRRRTRSSVTSSTSGRGTRTPLPAGVRAAYLKASREAVPSIVADYRASAGIDVAHDRADRDSGNRLRMPVTVLQQDWGAALGYDAAALWRAWAPDLRHDTVDCGHFMAGRGSRRGRRGLAEAADAVGPRAAGPGGRSGRRRPAYNGLLCVVSEQLFDPRGRHSL